MYSTLRKFFGPYEIPGGGEMSFAIFAVAVVPLLIGAVIAHAVMMHGLSGESAYLAMLPPAIVAFALLFERRDEAERKKVKEWLDLIWRAWNVLAFVVVFHSLAVGSPFSVESVLGSIPVELQAVLFGLFGGTLAAHFGLFAAPHKDRSRPISALL